MGDLSLDFDLLRRAVRDAAEVTKSYIGRTVSQDRKADGSTVTEADMAADALLASRLRTARPDYGWLSEESPAHETRLSRSRVWIVDPIDGTRDFLSGGKDWTVAACLVEAGRPVLACVVNPVREEIFEARAGAGARLNGQPISASTRNALADARVATGTPRKSSWRAPWPGAIPVFTNSIIYRLALIAAGRADASFALNPKWEWDIAAGVLLVSEAGGIVAAPNGAPLEFNSGSAKVEGFAAAARDLHPLLVHYLNARGSSPSVLKA